MADVNARLEKIEKRLRRTKYSLKKRRKNIKFLEEFLATTKPSSEYKQKSRRARRERAEELHTAIQARFNSPELTEVDSVEVPPSEEETSNHLVGNAEFVGHDKTAEELLADLAIQKKLCAEKCKEIDMQIKVLKEEQAYPFELKKTDKLKDLLVKLILAPVPEWRSNIYKLIEIPQTVKGGRTSGPSYFEALFQLAFYIGLFEDIQGYHRQFIMKKKSSKEDVLYKNFLYEKEINNQGGDQTGISDITFRLTKHPDSSNESKYMCGQIPEKKETPAEDMIYFVSVKRHTNEKSIKYYDIGDLFTYISQEYPGLKNFLLCVCCKNDQEFRNRMASSRSEYLSKSLNKLYGLEGLLDNYEKLRSQVFSNIGHTPTEDELIAWVSKHYPETKEVKPALSLYFHQELIVESVVQRIETQADEKKSQYICIGVLPRGGKSFIAGGIIKRQHEKKKAKGFNVLFLTSAISETMSQFSEDLINKFSDFDDFQFVDLRKDELDDTHPNKFIFVSRELMTGKDTGDDGSVQFKEIFRRLGYTDKKMPLDLVIFDEAHRGGITERTKSALHTNVTGNPPFILMTATYKKLLSENGYISKKDDLFIWDLDDIETMKKLPAMGFSGFKEGEVNASGKSNKFNMFYRFGRDGSTIITDILERRESLGETPQTVAQPYINFPTPYFLSASFSPEIIDKLQLHKRGGGNEGFAIENHFMLESTEGKSNPVVELLKDNTKWNDWWKALKFKQQAIALRSYLTPHDTGSDDYIVELNEKTKVLNRIFSITARDMGVKARPMYGKPFSILMFLPTGMSGSKIGMTCRAWGSLLLQSKYWRDNFIVLGLSELNMSKGSMAGGDYELLTFGGGKVKRGMQCTSKSPLDPYCSEENLSGDDLKQKISKLERKALEEGKGLVILTGLRAAMGISLPCVDLVCMFDTETEADGIIQRMYRALTDSPGKKYGFIFDFNIKRIFQAKYEYADFKNFGRLTERPTMTDLIEQEFNTSLWDSDAWVDYERGENFNDFMMQIRNHLFENLEDSLYKEAEKSVMKMDKSFLDADKSAVDVEIWNILRGAPITKTGRLAKEEFAREGVDLPSAAAAAPLSKNSVGSDKATSAETPGTDAEDALSANEEVINTKAQLQARDKLVLLTKQFVNLLYIRNQEVIAGTNMQTLESLLAFFDTEKKGVKLEDLTENTCDESNFFKRIFFDMINYISVPKSTEAGQLYVRTWKLLEFIRRRFVSSETLLIYSNYLESFKMSVTSNPPDIQTGGSVSSTKRYNEILQVIDDHLVPSEAGRKERGEIFTPPNLCREMLFGLNKEGYEAGELSTFGLDKEHMFVAQDDNERAGGLPEDIWKNPNLKWLDMANGIGNFPIIAFYKLDFMLRKQGSKTINGKKVNFADDDQRRAHIINNMLYMIELDPGNIETSKGLFKKIYPGKGAKPNILCGNSLKLTFDEIAKAFGTNKFDIIMGNPPFNPPKTETGSSGNSIWQNFVVKAFYMLNDNGYLCFVHPPGWKKPTESSFKFEKGFEDGDFTGKVYAGSVWPILKENGCFEFIYTNDQRSKHVGKEYLTYFPAVDYYIFKKKGEASTTDTKNIFQGALIGSLGVKLNYKLNYLPNLITSQTQDILHKLTTKAGDKISFGRFRDAKGFSVTHGKFKYIYTYDKNSNRKYQYSDKRNANIDMDKVVMNFDGGIDSYTVEYIKGSEKIGSYEMTMFAPVESDAEGRRVEDFFRSDIVKFIFLITQYSHGARTKNEPLVANSLTIPPAGIKDYYSYFGIEKHRKYIEKFLADYILFKAPKRGAKTEKAKRPAAGGRFNKTRKLTRN